MAHFQRLIFGCLVALMAWLPASSFAAVPPVLDESQSGVKYCATRDCATAYWQGQFQYFSTPEAAGNFHWQVDPVAGAGKRSMTCTTTSCALDLYRLSDGYEWIDVNYAVSSRTFPPVYSCPANSTLSGSSCVCNSGFSENSSHTACVVPPSNCDWAKGQTQVVFGTFQIERGKELCSSGCGFALKADAGASPESSRLNGTSPWMDTRTMGDFSGTGSVCASATTGATTGTTTPSPYPPGEDATPPKDTCPTGKVGGTVNGAFVCVTPGETVTAKKAETTNNDGTDTKKDTVQKSTNCVGATCTTTTNTTTTTTNNSSGTVTTSTAAKTEVQSKGDYCKTNATDKACLGVGSGSFSGTCGAAPACSGDAVMCAIAAATFETKCAFALPEGTDSISEIAAYAAAKLKTGSQLADLPGSETVDVGSSKFDQTNLLGSAAGMHDVSVTVMGRSIVLPFSGVNVWLARFGLALQAVTFLVCAYIVTGQRSRA